MPNQAIIDYIKKNIEIGNNIEDAKKNLISAGWNINEIEEAVKYLNQENNINNNFSQNTLHIPDFNPEPMLEGGKKDNIQTKNTGWKGRKIIMPLIVIILFVSFMAYSVYNGTTSLVPKATQQHNKELNEINKDNSTSNLNNHIPQDYFTENGNHNNLKNKTDYQDTDNNKETLHGLPTHNFTKNNNSDNSTQESENDTIIDLSDIATKSKCKIHTNVLTLNISVGKSKGIFASGFKGKSAQVKWDIEDKLIASLMPSEGTFTSITGLSPGFTKVIVKDLSIGDDCSYKVGVTVTLE